MNNADRQCEWIICTEELAPTTGTPHLQGFILYKNKIHWTAMERTFDGCWFEPAKGTPEHNWVYIRKTLPEDANADDLNSLFHEYGTRPRFGVSEAQKNQRQNAADRTREMWDGAYQAAREGRFDDIPPQLLVPHFRNFRMIYQEERNRVEEIRDFVLRRWQQKLMDILDGAVDTRKIHWFWENTGNVGKSWMATFLLRNKGATVLSSGKNADIAYLLDQPKIVVFDISRDSMEHTNFGVMEDIKNGRIFSPKYESRVKCFDIPHLIVFANEPCPYGKFSADRIQEHNLSEIIPELEREIPEPVLRRTEPDIAIGDYSLDNVIDSIWSPPIEMPISEEENRENIRRWINEAEGVPENTNAVLGSFVWGFNRPN